MKRTFALILACSMLFTLSIGAFARTDDVDYPVTEIYDEGYLLDEDDSYVDFNSPFEDSVPYGETIYFPLLSDYTDITDSGNHYVGVYESSATKKIKIKTDWDEGSSYVDKLSVVKKRYTGSISSNIDLSNSKYVYFLAIKTKTRSTTTTSKKDVYGTIKLRKSGDYGFDYDDMQVEVEFEVGYTAPEDSNLIPIDPALFIPEEDFDEYDEETFDFEADSYSYFVVNTNNQKKIVLGMDTDYDDDIADRFPNANLDFFNGNGASFNKLGYLYLYADDSNYIYEVKNDDALKKLNCSYDSYEDCFIVRTRTLGRYVISDKRLDVAETSSKSDEDTAVIFDNDTQTNYNPGTGGFGFDDIAYNTPDYSNTTSIAPAVTSNPVIAPAVTDQSNISSSNSEAEEPTEKDEPTIIGTTKKADIDLAAPAINDTVTNGTITGSHSLGVRKLLMIVCSVGAIASAIGLLIFALVSFNKSRQKYY